MSVGLCVRILPAYQVVLLLAFRMKQTLLIKSSVLEETRYQPMIFGLDLDIELFPKVASPNVTLLLSMVVIGHLCVSLRGYFC